MTAPVLEMTVISEIATGFDKYSHLLPGHEVSRRTSPDGERILIAWSMPDAPATATVMSPWFTLTGDAIRLGGIDYYDANQQPIN